MYKLILIPLLCTAVYSSTSDTINTISIVTLVGAKIKASHNVLEKKYPRKDCPVCEGKGWYISGDKIKKVDCGYCEPETKEIQYESNRSKVINNRQ